MVDDKFIGMALAILASCAIGLSYVITKTGLAQAAEYNGFNGEGHEYLRNPIWWCGMLTLISGEVMNTVEYAFAPAVLVTPLGALSVLVSTVMGAYFLHEEVRTLGRLGYATCLLGSIMLVLHAPPDEEIQEIDETIHLSIQPLFLLYCLFVTIFSTYMIYIIAPKSGKTNPLVYISICSSVGSISVMMVKAFSIAVKLTIGEENEFLNSSTYVFLIVLVVMLLTQMNYLNKAMDVFPVSIINAMFYVVFTTCTLSASFILYGGFNTTDAITTISLVCGFLLNFFGIALLTLSKTDVQAGDYTLADNTRIPASPVEMQNLGYARVSTSRSTEVNRESDDGHRNRRSVNSR